MEFNHFDVVYDPDADRVLINGTLAIHFDALWPAMRKVAITRNRMKKAQAPPKYEKAPKALQPECKS